MNTYSKFELSEAYIASIKEKCAHRAIREYIKEHGVEPDDISQFFVVSANELEKYRQILWGVLAGRDEEIVYPDVEPEDPDEPIIPDPEEPEEPDPEEPEEPEPELIKNAPIVIDYYVKTANKAAIGGSAKEVEFRETFTLAAQYPYFNKECVDKYLDFDGVYQNHKEHFVTLPTLSSTKYEATLTFTVVMGTDKNGEPIEIEPGTLDAVVRHTIINNRSNWTLSQSFVSVTDVYGNEYPFPHANNGGAVILYESFDQCQGKGGNDGNFSGGDVGTAEFVPDLGGWKDASGSDNVKYASGAYQCAKFGTSKVQGVVMSPIRSHSGRARISFNAAAWAGTSTGLELIVYVNDTQAAAVTMPTDRMEEFSFDYELDGTFFLKFVPTGRFFLDEVKVVELL